MAPEKSFGVGVGVGVVMPAAEEKEEEEEEEEDGRKTVRVLCCSPYPSAPPTRGAGFLSGFPKSSPCNRPSLDQSEEVVVVAVLRG